MSTTTYNLFDSSSGLTLENSQVASGLLSTSSGNLVSRTTGQITPSPTSATIDTFLATLARKPGNTQCWRQISVDGTNWKNRYGEDVANTGCYSFDGVNDQITVANHADFQMGTGAFTLSCWVCGTAANQYGLIFGMIGANGHEWGIYQAAAATGTTTGKKIRVVLSQSGSVERRRLSAGDLLADAQWHHIAVVSNGSTLLLYFDGYLVSTTDTNTGAWPSVAPTTNAVTIGGQTSKWWAGKIDDVRYYNVAVNAADIAILVENHHDASSSNRRLHLRLDGDAVDASGYSHDGTIVGASSVTDFTLLPPFGDQLFGEIGSHGQCAMLDGVNDKFTYAYNAAFHSASTLSVFLWMKSTSTSSTRQDMAARYQATGNKRGWLLGVVPSTGKLQVVLTSEGIGVLAKNYLSSITGLSDGNWHHVGFTWNAGTLKLYVDGVEDTTPTKTTDAPITTIFDPGSGTNFTIGAIHDPGASNWFAGDLANCGLWNDVRSGAEITASYAAGFEDDGDANIIGYWPLGYDGSLLTDLGPGNYTLTNSGGVTLADRWTRPLPTFGIEKTLNVSGLSLTTTAYWRMLSRSTVSGRTTAIDSVGFVSTDAPPSGGPFPHFLRRTAMLSGGMAA